MSIKKQIIDWWASGVSYSPEYQAVLTYGTAQGYELPSVLDRVQEDAFVRLLVSSGIWNLSDQILNLSASGDRSFALINIKNPGTYNASLSATAPTWLKGIGFFGNGSSSYINTNFAPSGGTNYTQNSAGCYITILDSLAGSATAVDFGAADAGSGKGMLSSIRVNTNVNSFIVNSDTVVSIANTDALGSYGFSRSGATTTKLYKNGSQVGATSSVASTGRTTRSIYLGAYNNAGSPGGYSARRIGFWLAGAAIDTVVSLLETYLANYLASSSTISSPTFSDKTSSANYLTSIGGLSSSFTYGEPSQDIVTSTSGIWFGGALASNGIIYCSPGAATVGLKINTSTKASSTFGTFSAGTFKYGGAVFANGSIYFIPATANTVAKVNISTDAVTWLDSTGVVGSDTGGNLGATTQKWYGAYRGVDGKIYCIPYNATSVLVINPSTDAITFIDTTGTIGTPSGNLTGTGKWDAGGQVGNFLYGAPSDATDAIKINTSNGTCSRVGTFPAGTSKWVFAVLAPNGYLYMMPYYDNRIIKYNPSDDSFSYLATTIGSIDTNQKTGGTTILPNGKILIVMAASNYTSHYILDPSNDSLTAFTRYMTSQATNGAILATDGSVYCPPIGGTSIMRFWYPRKTISLPDNFTDNNYKSNY